MKRRGVTLIELLIAITLVSLLTVGIMYAMRIGLDALGRSNQRLIDNRRALGVDRIMHEQLAGFMPVKAGCRTGPTAPPAWVPFFQGGPQTLRMVSAYSLEEAARGYPRILEYQVIPGENGEGVRLIVNEAVYSGPLSTGVACIGLISAPTGNIGRYRPVETNERSFVLADKLERCQFAYKELLKEPPFERWVPEWRSARYPAAIRIDMEPLDREAVKLKVLPVTVPIRVDRDVMVQYEN
jgi:general secretion pathway protein J